MKGNLRLAPGLPNLITGLPNLIMIFRRNFQRIFLYFFLLSLVFIILLNRKSPKKKLSTENCKRKSLSVSMKSVQDFDVHSDFDFEKFDQKITFNLNLNLNNYLNQEMNSIENEQEISKTRFNRYNTHNSYSNHSKISLNSNQSDRIEMSADRIEMAVVTRLIMKSTLPRQRDPILVVREWKNYIKQRLAESESHRQDSLSDPDSNESSFINPSVTVNKMKHIRPKIIWTYWPGGEGQLPLLLSDCIYSWRRYNPHHTIIILSRKTIEKILDFSLPIHFDEISYHHQKDWVKLAVLLHYGGTWIEPSFVMTGSISFVEQKLKESDEKKEGLMFFMDYYTFYPKFPFFEGYFISVSTFSFFII